MFPHKFGKSLATAAGGIAILAVFFSTSMPAFALDTGYLSPTAQAPAPGGDSNGFEVNPTNAFAGDSLVAADMSSGTLGTLVCTDPNRDKHDFFNYGVSVPNGSTI